MSNTTTTAAATTAAASNLVLWAVIVAPIVGVLLIAAVIVVFCVLRNKVPEKDYSGRHKGPGDYELSRPLATVHNMPWEKKKAAK